MSVKHAGRSQCSDKYSGGKICKWSFEEYFHNLREEVKPRVDVFLATISFFGFGACRRSVEHLEVAGK